MDADAFEMLPHAQSSFANERISTDRLGVLLEYRRSQPCQNDQLIYIADHEDLANNLERLQSSENDGRGVSCVRTAIVYLRRQEFAHAKAVIDTESDKIGNYPTIVAALQAAGLWYRIRFGEGMWA